MSVAFLRLSTGELGPFLFDSAIPVARDEDSPTAADYSALLAKTLSLLQLRLAADWSLGRRAQGAGYGNAYGLHYGQ